MASSSPQPPAPTAAPSTPSLAPAQPRDSQTIQLPDGRTLGFAEYGAPGGYPVLYFHGFPSSRYEGISVHKAARRANLRILALDRPGFGLSTPQPGRTLMDYPADVRAFVDTQQLRRFGIIGVSGGGPHVLACVRAFQPQVGSDENGTGPVLTHAGVVAGAGGFEGQRDVVPTRSRRFDFLARHFPRLTRVVMAGVIRIAQWAVRTRTVEGWIDKWLEQEVQKEEERVKAKEAAKEVAKKEAADKVKAGDSASVGEDFEVLAAPTEGASDVAKGETVKEEAAKGDADEYENLTIADRRELLVRQLFENYAQGTQPILDEAYVLSDPFGFEPEDITFNPLMFWHGDKDVNVPLAWAKRTIDRIPHGVLKVYENMTHGSIFEKADEIIAHFVPK